MRDGTGGIARAVASMLPDPAERFDHAGSAVNFDAKNKQDGIGR